MGHQAHQATSVLSVYFLMVFNIMLPSSSEIKCILFAHFYYMTNFVPEIPHMQKAASDPDSTFRKPPMKRKFSKKRSTHSNELT